jgi:hypothetical protein
VANDLEVEVRIVGVGDHVGQYVDCCLRAIRANSLDIQQEALDLSVGVVNLLEILRVSTRVSFVRFQRGCLGGSEGADEHHGAVRAFGKVNHVNLDVDFRFQKIVSTKVACSLIWIVSVTAPFPAETGIVLPSSANTKPSMLSTRKILDVVPSNMIYQDNCNCWCQDKSISPVALLEL